MTKVLCAIAAVILCVACGGESGLPDVPPVVAVSPDSIRFDGINYSHDGKRLVFWTYSREANNLLDLWVANADFTNQLKLPIVVPSSSFSIPAVWSYDDKWIAASTSQFGGGTLAVAVVPSTGGSARQVTHGSGNEWPTGWHADNDHLDYAANAGNGTQVSYVVSVSTGKSVRTLPNEKRTNFALTSPDGRHIVYQLSEGDKQTIWVADSGGRNPRQLTTEGFETFLGNASPWSPDGTRIAYQSQRTGTSDVWVVSIADSQRLQLTRDIRNDYDPVWSPDGKWIAFKSARGKTVDLWIVPAAGGIEQRVTRLPGDKWSPKWQAGTGRISIMNDQTKAALWAVDVQTGAERRLTPDSLPPTFGYPIAVTPDGATVVFPIDRGGDDYDLAAVPLAGGAPRVIAASQGFVGDIVMSPDGSKVAFDSDKSGVLDIWVADVSGGPARRVTDWPGLEFNPEWSGDGRSLLFLADRDAVGADLWKIPAAGGAAVRVTKSGGMNGLIGRTGLDFVYVNVRGKSGKNTLARVRSDGALETAWDSSSSYMAGISPTGDSIVAVVQVQGGHQETRIQSVKTGRGRRVLKPDELGGYWSNDGKRMTYAFSDAGGINLGVLDLATGATHRVTTTRDFDNAYSQAWVAGDKSVVFVRQHLSTRFTTIDVSKLLAATVPK